MADNRKGLFGEFFGFSFSFLGGGLFVVFVFLGGFKGQVRWPKGSPHLATNLIYFFIFFVCLFFVVFGGFKGQVRWPTLLISLGFFVLFVSCFLFFVCFWKKNLVSIKKGHFCLFLSVSLCFSLAFLPPPFSLYLSLSPLCYFLSSFLIFFFAFFWFLVFVSFFIFLCLYVS